MKLLSMSRMSRFTALLPGAGLVVALAALLSLHPAPARAADSAPCSALEGVLAGDANDSIAVLLAARARDAVRTDLEAAHSAALAAEGDAHKAHDLLAKMKDRIEIKKGEIDALKGRAKLAKEQNNAADQQALEAQVDAQKLQLDLLQAVRDLRSAEQDLGEARKSAAEARAKFHERELEFLAKHDELDKQAATAGSNLVVLET